MPLVTEREPATFDVVWRTSAARMPIGRTVADDPLVPALPAHCRRIYPPEPPASEAGARVFWRVACDSDTPGFVSNDGWPLIDWWTGGWTGGMLDGFDRLLEVANASTRIVPANGPPMTFAELKAQQAMYTTVFGRIHDLLVKALGTDEVLAAKPTAEYDAKFGDPKLFVTLAFQSTWGHLRDAYDTRLRNIA